MADLARKTAKELAEQLTHVSELWRRRREVVAASRCQNCGMPILKMRAPNLHGNDNWLHPKKIDVPPNEQIWELHCYRAPVAEPEPNCGSRDFAP